MTSADLYKMNLVYIAKSSDINRLDLLMHSDLPGDVGRRIAQLDVAAGWILSEIRRRKTYPRMLNNFGRKIRRQGFSLIGKVIGEGKIDDNNYVDVWAPDKPSFPPDVDAVPLDLPIIYSPPREMDGVFGGKSRIMLGQHEVTDTLMTHGYRYASGHLHIPSTDRLSKYYKAR